MRSVALILVLVVASLLPQQSRAQGYWGGSEAYRFGSTGGFTNNITSANGGFGGNFGFNKTFDFLGCSFNLSQFIQANFNLPSNFEEIKEALQTRLVKYAITNFTILPQLQAALQDFQAKLGTDLRFARESCNLSSLGQEQKRIQMRDCERKWGNDPNKFQDCIKGSGEVGKSVLAGVSQEINKMTASMCRSVTESARSLFCGGAGECAIMQMLPQMRLTCNGQGHVIGGETQNAPIGVGTIGQGFTALIQSSIRINYNVLDSVRAQGATEDQLDNLARAAAVLARDGAAAATASVQPGLQFFELNSTQFGNTAGSGAGADDALDAEKVKRKKGCKVDDPLAVGKYLARAASAQGFSVQEPQINSAEQQAIGKAILASLSTRQDNLGALQARDAAGVLKAIEVIGGCGMNGEGGIDIATYVRLAKMDADTRESYMVAKAMQRSCADGEFLLDNVEDGAEAGVAKAKIADEQTPAPEAAADARGTTMAGKEKLEAFAQFAKETIEDANETLKASCKARRESSVVDKALYQVEGADAADGWQADI